MRSRETLAVFRPEMKLDAFPQEGMQDLISQHPSTARTTADLLLPHLRQAVFPQPPPSTYQQPYQDRVDDIYRARRAKVSPTISYGHSRTL